MYYRRMYYRHRLNVTSLYEQVQIMSLRHFQYRILVAHPFVSYAHSLRI